MHRIHHFGRLLDQSDCRAHRSLQIALTNRHFGRTTKPLTILRHRVGNASQRRRRFFVRKWHHRLGNWHSTRLDQCTTTRRNAENIAVLPTTHIRIQKSRERGVHTGIEKFSPCCCHRVCCVAQNMQEANRVEPKARYENVRHELLARDGQVFGALVVITHDRQDFLRRYVDCYTIRNF